MILVLDPGHGGPDPGAIGPAGLQESSATLILAMHLYPQVALPGRKVYLTRWDDSGLHLSRRTDMARCLGADAFVSLHFNSATDQTAQGVEVLYYPGSGPGRALAQAIQERLVKALGLRDRGIKSRPDLHVLRETTCPAVLVETAFLSQPEEEALFDPRGSLAAYAKAARAIAEGISAWAKEWVT